MDKHLYIIGNGFDIHHGINSSYLNFSDWMQMQNSDVIEDFENAYGECDEEWWADFENKLASLDIIEYASQIAFANQPDLASDHCDRMWNDALIEVEQQLDGLYSELRRCFHDWIMQLNKPLAEKKIKLQTDNSLFLNFNYTTTLETLYCVKSENVLHIHGCVGIDEDFIIGHGKTLYDLRKENPDVNSIPPEDLTEEEYIEWLDAQSDSKEFHEQLAEDAAFGGVASQRKPVEQIINRNEEFFRKLKGFNRVHVYGISFSQVDMPYLKRIAQETTETEWEFSDYNNQHRDDIIKFTLNNAIKKYKIMELESLMLKRQLDFLFQ